MSVAITDMKFRKPVTVADTPTNGGRRGTIEVLTGIRHNLFPRVTKTERMSGITRYRKEFFCNENTLNEVAYASLLFLETPSNAGDRYYISKGSPLSTQADVVAGAPLWTGVGTLPADGNLNGLGGEYAVKVTMEAADYQFANGGILHITNKVKLNQNLLTSGVNIGDSLQFDAGTSKWAKIGYTSNITFPKGLFLGGGKVMTIESGTFEDFLVIADNMYSNEVIGTQSGSVTAVPLATLAHKANGICAQAGKLPVITAICGGDAKTVTIGADGSASGYCSAGQLNLTSGIWSTPINWSVAPDNGTDILITYREKCYSYSGNTATIQLNEAVPHAYATGNTYVGGCVEGGDLAPWCSDPVINGALGTFNANGTLPPGLTNLGTIEDEITVTFSTATNFTVAGLNAGAMGTGSTLGDFSFTNPATNALYIKLYAASWGGTWVAGNTVKFTTTSASVPVWFKEVVPANISPESYNLLPLGWYCE